MGIDSIANRLNVTTIRLPEEFRLLDKTSTTLERTNPVNIPMIAFLIPCSALGVYGTLDFYNRFHP